MKRIRMQRRRGFVVLAFALMAIVGSSTAAFAYEVQKGGAGSTKCTVSAQIRHTEPELCRPVSFQPNEVSESSGAVTAPSGPKAPDLPWVIAAVLAATAVVAGLRLAFRHPGQVAS